MVYRIGFMALVSSLCVGLATGSAVAQQTEPGEPLLLAQSQSYCSQLGMLYCGPGSSGPGGCYGRGDSCVSGLICPSGTTQCSPGPGGPGGCYNQGYFSCFVGRICRTGPGCP
jgi:hypothetical protein